jgi:methyltransferase (TIGR00027 family)
MRSTASRTAAWVAAVRGLGSILGAEQVADDPFGARFGGRAVHALERAARFEPLRRALAAAPPLMHWVGYMQLRTRAIDDVLLDFVDDGGEQVVILGAGYDCRAARFAGELRDVTVFEVDHPATQARKREVLAEAGASPPVAYVTWDFEARPLGELPGVLARLGHDPARPTLTIWEGVTMYLTEGAIDATFAALRAMRSHVVFTYIERDFIERGGTLHRVLARIGEPWVFGWDPPALPAWLDARGFDLQSDREDSELADALLPPRVAAHVRGQGRHVAVAAPR